MENFNKNQQKSTKIIRISYIFFKTIKLMFTDINIYTINNKTDHISEKYIFHRKKVDKGRIWSRIRIRIRYFTKRIRGSISVSGSISKLNGSETLVLKEYLIRYFILTLVPSVYSDVKYKPVNIYRKEHTLYNRENSILLKILIDNGLIRNS